MTLPAAWWMEHCIPEINAKTFWITIFLITKSLITQTERPFDYEEQLIGIIYYYFYRNSVINVFSRKSPVQTKVIAHEKVWVVIGVLWNKYLPGHHPAIAKILFGYTMYIFEGKVIYSCEFVCLNVIRYARYKVDAICRRLRPFVRAACNQKDSRHSI